MADIIMTVPVGKWDTFKKYFLKIHPNQTLDSANMLSDDDWVKHRIYLFARGSYEKGLNQEHAEQNAPVPDPQIITLEET